MGPAAADDTGAAGTGTAGSRGRLYVGTSGFAYPDWAPRFYPAHLKGDGLLPYYAKHFPACELNNTFYQQPSESKVAAWLAATPDDFRFTVKAQRGGSFRALQVDPVASVPWLTAPLLRFGDRLGSVLFRVPEQVLVDLPRLEALLAEWPRGMPLTMEFKDPSWHVDEVIASLTKAGAALCATELPEDDSPPTLRLTGRFLYLRLRRHEYERPEIEAWAARLAPFLDSGTDAFVFFRHDETGRATAFATALSAAVAAA
ncbi:MAG: DUF72 domain-containing protein, partial [Chloroflexota bacterium]|nr:DUF72 domain-containing protein [Chloroflexota bacterium]